MKKNTNANKLIALWQKITKRGEIVFGYPGSGKGYRVWDKENSTTKNTETRNKK